MIDTAAIMKNSPWSSPVLSPVSSPGNPTASTQPVSGPSKPFQNVQQFPQQARQSVIKWGSYDPTLAENKGQPELLRQHAFLMRWLNGQGQQGQQGQGGRNNGDSAISFGMNF